MPAVFVRQQVSHWAGEQAIALDDDSWAKLEVLGELWRRYGRALNLTGDPSEEGLSRQIRDGLATLLCAQRGGALGAQDVPWVDVGSGAGFPGLVIAATCPNACLTLVEPRQRRASFLELALRSIESSSTSVVRARFESQTWAKNPVAGVIGRGDERFSIASARAVWSPAEWLTRGRELVYKGGFIIVHRGADEHGKAIGDAVEVVALDGGTVELYRAQ